MSKEWDYSELSKLASRNGGPQELLRKHAAHHQKIGYESGFSAGSKSKNPYIALAWIVGSVGASIGTKAYLDHKAKKAEKLKQQQKEQAEIEKIESELVKGMEEAARSEENK